MWPLDSKYMPPRYDSLEESMVDDENSEDSISENTIRNWQKGAAVRSPLPWIVSTFVFAALSSYLYLQQWRVSSLGTFERGFSTDFAPAKTFISIEQREFTGSPKFSDDGTEYIPEGSETMQYMGEPSPEIDEAWNVLTRNRYFLLSDEEAYAAWGDSYKEFWSDSEGGYAAGLDMFHILHCLDHIRKAFYPETYRQIPIHGQMHRDHCIDHLRQMVMCNGDITLIPTVYYESIGHNYINSDRPHTCRDFQAIREYVWNRNNGTAAVPRRRTTS